MANILVCIEDTEVNRESGTYYSKAIDPGLSKLGHEIKLTTCEYVGNLLENNQPDILLFLVTQKQSCCWPVAQSVRDEGNLSFASPAILMVIKWGPGDSPENPAYFTHPEYAKLYDDYYEGFTGIAWWVSDFITRKHLDQPQISGSVDALNLKSPIVISSMNDAFRYNDEKQNHLAELLHHHHHLIPHLYIVNGEGNVLVGQVGHHSNLAQGGNVYGAGEIFLTRQKEAVRIDDQTGNYYAPVYQGKTFGQQFRDYLKGLLTERYHFKIDDTVFRGTMN